MTRDIGKPGKPGEIQEVPEPEKSAPVADRAPDARTDQLADPRESSDLGDGPEIADSVVSYEVVFEERKGKHWESYGSLTETRELAPEQTDAPKEAGWYDAWDAEHRRPAEQCVTPDLQSFEATGFGHLEGLDYRFKGQERFMEKVTAS